MKHFIKDKKVENIIAGITITVLFVFGAWLFLAQLAEVAR